MRNLNIRIKQTLDVLSLYTFDIPFSDFLKSYFKKNKKMGKNDRKEISQVCYSYFRIGYLLAKKPTEQTLYQGYCILYNLEFEVVSAALDQQQFKQLNLSNLFEIFTNNKELPKPSYFDTTFSKGVNKKDWFERMYTQPETYIRVLDNNCLSELNQAFEIEHVNGKTYKAKQGVKITDTQAFLEGKVYIQDYSSQNIIDLIPKVKKEIWWDACCGSGGKSLLFVEKNPTSTIFGSDIRDSILVNYKNRIKLSYSKIIQTFNYDLSLPFGSQHLLFGPVDGIILDVPCSGSGTWARNPENLVSFNQNKLQFYTNKQKKILTNALNHLNKNGQILYITCSVFYAENEDIISHVQNLFSFDVAFSGIINRGNENADYLFATLLIKK